MCKNIELKGKILGVQLVLYLSHSEISVSENMQRLDLHKQKVHVDTSSTMFSLV